MPPKPCTAKLPATVKVLKAEPVTGIEAATIGVSIIFNNHDRNTTAGTAVFRLIQIHLLKFLSVIRLSTVRTDSILDRSVLRNSIKLWGSM